VRREEFVRSADSRERIFQPDRGRQNAPHSARVLVNCVLCG
jgi:hypothetical protein